MSFKLARLAHRGLPTGEPLPPVYKTLDDAGVRFYRGGVSLIGGTPGSMKTMFLLDFVDRLKAPTLYLSNDATSATMVSRALARRTRQDSRLMRDKAFEDPDWAGAVLDDMNYIRWNFDRAPTLEVIEVEMTAFEELWGEPPHVVVVDVLMKVDYHEEGGGTKESIIRYLDKLAGENNAAFFVAAHTSENVAGNPTQPMSSFLDKIAKLPETALTLAYADGFLHVAPVKVRDGEADATGNTFHTFMIDPSIATLEEM